MAFSVANEIVRAAKKLLGGDSECLGKENVLIGMEANDLTGVHDDVASDPRWKNNPARWDAPMLNINAAREIRHEEIKLGRSMTPAEQAAHIRKLCS